MFKRALKCVSLFCAASIILAGLPCLSTNAYVKAGWALSNPGNVTYRISTTVGPYTVDTINHIQKWQEYCVEIGGMTQVDTNENIYFYGDFNVHSGNYAVCYHHGDDTNVITYYNEFASLDSICRQETIVHEVGHALGLAHCEEGKESSSVMRETGFNQKAYPLSDDIEGISAIY